MLPYNFGLFTYSPIVMYVGGVLAILLSLFWRPITGLYYLIPVLPLQTVRYRMIDMPLGASMVTLVMFAVALGLIFHRPENSASKPWRPFLMLYCGYLAVSICRGSFYLGKSTPIYFDDSRFGDFKDYLLMPLLLICVADAVKSTGQMKIMLALLCLGMFAVDRGVWGTFSQRDYSTYSDTMRESGVMGQAGANGLGAFTAQAGVCAAALAAAERRFGLRLVYWALGLFSALCLMYTFSRGAYIAFFVGLIYVGIRKQRLLLAGIFVFALLWASVVPEAVRERIYVTSGGELDHSSETRVDLWQDALSIAGANIVFGTGLSTYAFMGRIGNYQDTHNIYVKVLVETGVVGLALFLWLLFMIFRAGSRLLRITDDPFLASLGLALCGWLVCSAIVNMFGDRWTFIQVNSYMWVLAGLVARGLYMEENDETEEEDFVSEPGVEPAWELSSTAAR